jgi:ArsR family transcriptional regulator
LWKYGNVDTKNAVIILASLAQEARLEIFRLLVQAGPAGLAAGDIATKLDMPASTLSFHIKELAHAGLVKALQSGRFIYYSAAFDVMNGLLAFLTENCCEGARDCCVSAVCQAESA